MLSIDEAIEMYKKIANTDSNCPRYCMNPCEYCVKECKQIAEWLEELKAIKEIDLSIPQHFTKEQSDWIKAYCIRRNLEFYNKAIDDFIKACDKKCGFYSGINKQLTRDMLLEIAEQLKAGGENE